MEHINRAAIEALTSELRRQGHDFKRDTRRGNQPPFVGPCDNPKAVFIHGCIDLEALVGAVLAGSAEQQIPA